MSAACTAVLSPERADAEAITAAHSPTRMDALVPAGAQDAPQSRRPTRLFTYLFLLTSGNAANASTPSPRPISHPLLPLPVFFVSDSAGFVATITGW